MNKQTLKETDIKHILKLQELFYNKFLNQELLNQLVCLYVKAIDCCSQKLSMMKIYFLQKMQFLLSRPQIQKLLTEKQSQNSTRDKFTIKISTLELEYETPQYVRKSSLHSQPVNKKLAQMLDNDQKIRERQNRIKVQLQLLRQVESSLNQIPLQKRKKQQNNGLSNKIKEFSFDDEEINLKQMLVNKNRKLRKNSDCFQNKKQIHDLFEGKIISKQYLISIQQEINSKWKNLNTKKYKTLKLNQLTIFKRKKNQFKSSYNNEEQMNVENMKKIEFNFGNDDSQDELVTPVFYPIQYGTFAPGHNTPQFSQDSNSCAQNNVSAQFPKPLQQSTDTSLISLQNRQISEQKDIPRPVQINDDESEYDYVNDEYF